MNLDQEDSRFLHRKQTPHRLIAFILASIVVSVSLFLLLDQNKYNRFLAQQQKPVIQTERPSHTWEQLSNPPQEQQAYQPKPEAVYTPPPQKTTVFKCKKTEGSIMYSALPCGSGHTTQLVTIEENVLDSRILRNKVREMRAMEVRTEAEPLRVYEINYMPEAEVSKRIKELEMDLQSITASQEKMSSARMEINILKTRKARLLTYEDENERAGQRRLLNSQNYDVRYIAFNKLIGIYNKY